ncbi:MAG: LysR family transcriptional regulator [Alkalispirochaeta sp.]
MIDNLLRFKKVVEAGSISKASRLLFVSQPALSQAIKLLEEEYGVEILERHPQGIRPTIYGDILYRTACEIERNVLSIETRMLEARASHNPDALRREHNEVNIGCSTIWNDFLLPEAMRSLDILDSYAINVTGSTSEQLLSDLMNELKYDFVLCRIVEDRRYRFLESIPLFRTQAAIFINDHHPIFSTGFDRERLSELKWIKLKSLPVLQAEDLTPAGLSFFPEDFLPPAISFEVEDLMTAIQLLRNNYIVLLPLALADLVENYGIKPIPFPNTLTNTYWLGMVYSKEREIPLYVRDLMNRIRLYFSHRTS